MFIGESIGIGKQYFIFFCKKKQQWTLLFVSTRSVEAVEYKYQDGRYVCAI
jgi:hypothetical protein